MMFHQLDTTPFWTWEAYSTATLSIINNERDLEEYLNSLKGYRLFYSHLRQCFASVILSVHFPRETAHETMERHLRGDYPLELYPCRLVYKKIDHSSFAFSNGTLRSIGYARIQEYIRGTVVGKPYGLPLLPLSNGMPVPRKDPYDHILLRPVDPLGLATTPEDLVFQLEGSLRRGAWRRSSGDTISIDFDTEENRPYSLEDLLASIHANIKST